MPRIEPFEEYSDAYDAWFDEHDDLYQAELAAMRQLIPPQGAIGLEVGIGSGKFAVPLGIKTGVEPSKQMAAKARAHGLDIYDGVAENLPFPNDRFDLVLMVTTVCFVDDIQASLAEAFRVLKPGGCIILGFVDKEGDLGRRYEAEKNKSRFYKHATFFSSKELLDDLEEAGFEIVSIRQTLVPGAPTDTVLPGFGVGAFVVIKGLRSTQTGSLHDTGL